MGASTSRSECHALGVTPNCSNTAKGMKDGREVVTVIGDAHMGEVSTDGDIAGIGVVSVFVGVTSLAFLLSVIIVAFNLAKWLKWKSTLTPEEKQKRSGCAAAVSLTALCETIVLSCSDQQIFTGGAYSITLRYFKGCSITAYHYNMVANMMLLTCATHLLSLTVVRDYWRYPWLACVRVLITFLLFLTTGLLLSNQNSSQTNFPTDIPQPGVEPAPMFAPAICYQNGESSIQKSLGMTFGGGGDQLLDVIKNSTLNNKIRGWNWYIMMLLFYLAAFLLEVCRSLNRGSEEEGRKRHSITRGLKRAVMIGPKSSKILSRIGRLLILLYLVGGMAISGAAIITTSQYLLTLRVWARNAAWLKTEGESRRSSEDDATAFGQMIPMILSLLTIFALFEKWSEMGSPDRADRRYGFSGTVTYRSRSSSRPPSGKNKNGSDGSLAPSGGNGGAVAILNVSDKTFSALCEAKGPTSPGSTLIGSNTVTPGLTPMTPAFSGVGSPRSVYDNGLASPPLPHQQSPRNPSQVRFPTGPASAPLLGSNPSSPQLSGTAEQPQPQPYARDGRGSVPDPRHVRSSSESHPLPSQPTASPYTPQWRHASVPTTMGQYYQQQTMAAARAPTQHGYENAEGYFALPLPETPRGHELSRRAT
ncbi:hypothetical protein MAPG_09220 [Magnaporthiopsis poae ATCC 64411]|uniref:Uncharacterized protein n=1 Tax=Magnaporthiopsis poae (strain ATCC 64411 / 73-15) TaxID=644358 RepID=A0A0C4E9D8_MAGP6|nr:hypothetical protein MAPG_09220 [Magnaporthiopsis poae ATCC 64411]